MIPQPRLPRHPFSGVNLLASFQGTGRHQTPTVGFRDFHPGDIVVNAMDLFEDLDGDV